MKLRRNEIDDLLNRYRIAPLVPAGTDSKKAATGGVLATVDVEAGEGDGALLRVAIDAVRATGRCPLDTAHALAMVRAFEARRLIPHDASFEHMFANLLTKISAAYVGGGLQKLSIGRLHLHETSYHLEGVVARAGAIRLRPRQQSDSHDKHVAYAQQRNPYDGLGTTSAHATGVESPVPRKRTTAKR